jgi:hypothetical protein
MSIMKKMANGLDQDKDFGVEEAKSENDDLNDLCGFIDSKKEDEDI